MAVLARVEDSSGRSVAVVSLFMGKTLRRSRRAFWAGVRARGWDGMSMKEPWGPAWGREKVFWGSSGWCREGVGGVGGGSEL